MLVESRAEDIVYTSLFSGIRGNYLRGSVTRAGLDPDNLPAADKTKMNFGSGGNTALKAWKESERGSKRERHPRHRPGGCSGRPDGGRIRSGAGAYPLPLISDHQLKQALGRGLAGILSRVRRRAVAVGEAADAIRAAATRGRLCGPQGLFHRAHVRLDVVRQATQSLSLFCRASFVRTAHAERQTDKGAAALIDIANRRPPADVLCSG